MDEDDLYSIGEMELVGDELDDLLDMVSGEDDDLADLLDDDDDDDDDVGARRGRGRRRRGGRRSRARRAIVKAVKRDRARTALRGGTRAVPATRSKGRVLMLGGAATQGTTAGQLLIPTTVQDMARVDRLFISGVDGTGTVLPPASYSIADIKVGTGSQFAGLPPLPGIMFTADATSQGKGLQLDTTQPGTDFTVIIANAPVASTFNWGAYATSLR